MSEMNGGSAGAADRTYVLQIYPRLLQQTAPSCTLVVSKDATAVRVIQQARATLGLDGSRLYELVEVREPGGQEWVLEEGDFPVQRTLLWPPRAQSQHLKSEGYYFHLQQRAVDGPVLQTAGKKETAQPQLAARGFISPQQQDFDDLCHLPVLTEAGILDNLRARFHRSKIYTYAGNILVAVNPFKFLPIYNPKDVRMYDKHKLGQLPPHIFAVADVAYYTMLHRRANQCMVISGESGSGKTQSTNFLIHCLTALSHKGYACGVERTILGAGPVLEAFGNAKTAHNDNSSRFGKFIQVNYLESGVVRGAVVEKYLLEKCRLVSREQNERNYHVFYYLLVGATEEERREFKLLQPEDYLYLKQNLQVEDEADLRHEFKRLQQAMEMVGFLPATKKQIFSMLSAILYLGNVTYHRKSDDGEDLLDVGPPEVLTTLSDLLQVEEELLVEALTKRRTVTRNDTLILPYSHSEAITARDSMAKSLYGALFDWIVLRINHSLLNKKDMEESVPCLSIGILDIFGFEDFRTNSFEQFCINYANEQLQYYFNQYVFKLQQEEYQEEGITWHNIDYTDNVGCIHLISKKPTGLLYLLDEESNFPHATDQTLLAKFKQQHHGSSFFLPTPVMEPAFVIRHFAGKVKYQIKDFRAKNTDHMRHDIVALLRSSDRAFIRQLIGVDPVAVFRWGVLRAIVRSMAAFNKAGRNRAAKNAGLVRRGSRTPIGELRKLSFPRVERMQSRSSLIDFSFDRSEEHPLEVLEDIFASYESRKKSKGSRQKQLIPKNLLDARSLKFIVGRTLHDRTTKSLLHLHSKKKTPSISAQFQVSLSKLLETLGKAEPFFIRCIRSNAEKKEMFFDEALVLQQLRYTGMLETVRIRRSGYSAKYTFQEFTEQFRALLPKDATEPQKDISALLQKMGLDSATYQIGKTKVFLKEPQRQQLQEKLHQDVMCRIVFLQRCFRAQLERRHFLRMREAAIVIQRSWRSLQQENQYRAATIIQALWRGSQQRADYLQKRSSIIKMQAMVRASSARRRYRSLRVEEQARRRQEQEGEGEKKGAGEVGGTGGPASGAAQGEAGAEAKGQDRAPAPAPAADQKEEANAAKPDNRARPPQLQKSAMSRSQEKRELRRQRGVEHSQRESERIAGGGEDQPIPEVKGQQDVSGVEGRMPGQGASVAGKANEEQEKKQAGVPPPLLPRPATLPQFPPHGDEPPGPSHTGSLQRYNKKSALKEKGDRWRERRSEGAFLDSEPEPHCLKDKRTKTLMTQGLSMSLDNISKFSSSESDSPGPGPETNEVRVRLRKHSKHKRKRRLACARSGLMFNKSAEMEDVEYWTFPLPPISPGGPYVRPSRSPLCDAPPSKPSKPRVQFKSPTETTPNGSKVSIQGKRPNESSGHQSSSHSQLTPTHTPEKTGFLRRILRKRNHKEARTPEDGDVTMAQTLVDGAVQSKYSPYTRRSSHMLRDPSIRISRATRVSMQWNASLEREITNTNELRHLDEFLGNQVNDLRSRGQQLSGTEHIFLDATMMFRETIKSMYSLSKPQVGYKGLMNNYQNMVAKLAGTKQKAEVQLVINLFQSVLDGFIRGEMKREEAEPAKPTKKQKKDGSKNKCENILDHMFSTYQVTIMQSCDQCNSYIWGMEKAFMCRSCKMVCHKKCLSKISTDCSSLCAKKHEEDCVSQHFGVHVCLLTTKSNPVPVVMEKLLGHVEINGLYTEGIYRKSGSASRARELHHLLENEPLKVCLDDYPIHTIAGLLKQWLRELPDPLMTYSHYNDFLRAVELPEQSEKLHAVYKVLDQLPPANFNTLERLVFHLVRVAKEEVHNRMSPNSLAIVFAPCLLRSPDTSNPFLSMNDVGKTTLCVEILINEQIRRYNEKMEDIEQLEIAEALAVNELKLKRQNTVMEKAQKPDLKPTDSDNEEKTLIERIKSIKQEKDELACRLPELEQPGSDLETLDMDMSMSCESLADPRFGELNVEGKVTPSSKNQKLGESVRLGSNHQSGSPTLGARGTPDPAPEKRQEQPGRRKDAVQSMYIASGQDSSQKALKSSAKVNRPFSEANIPYIDEEV
ncbi:unconventional myosin-IXb-like isoform X2 [Megalops cyprinoides]|uniref:unconventional myosin-IXb-like isoform X2 n=1 Tax=Megalops cyprinoides TaxID=118141 RepID=UPI00186521FF|nr:unconventional myosin-IXb-like isoform X2 [Megalops cyprinoides]